MNFFNTLAYNDNDYVIVYSCISTLLKKDIEYKIICSFLLSHILWSFGEEIL